MGESRQQEGGADSGPQQSNRGKRLTTLGQESLMCRSEALQDREE